MPASAYDWRIVDSGLPFVVSAGPGSEGTEWEVLHTTREAEGTMAVTVTPVRLEQGVTHCGLVTV